jgi:hypothetical protein
MGKATSVPKTELEGKTLFSQDLTSLKALNPTLAFEPSNSPIKLRATSSATFNKKPSTGFQGKAWPPGKDSFTKWCNDTVFSIKKSWSDDIPQFVAFLKEIPTVEGVTEFAQEFFHPDDGDGHKVVEDFAREFFGKKLRWISIRKELGSADFILEGKVRVL